jgi:hypothetical protein
LPAWMTDAAACAALTVGASVVSIAALQGLLELLDAVPPRTRVLAKVASGAGDAPHDEQGLPQRRPASCRMGRGHHAVRVFR